MTENMASPGLNTSPMINRQSSMNSAMSESAVPTEDPKNTVDLLIERLGAWKHVVDTLEDYISTTEKAFKAQGKEYEKVLRTLRTPPKAGHHFDQNIGGIASLFENMRQNTHAIIDAHHDTEQKVKGTILPLIERLRKDIKTQHKELSSGAARDAKEVERARNVTQKYIELLAQSVAGFEVSGGKLNSTEDPYVLRRDVLHHLSKQLTEENNQRQSLISLQQNFNQFEQRVVEVIHTSIASLTNHTNLLAQSQQEHYSDIMKTAQAIPLDFEWNGFMTRFNDILVDPNIPDRNMDVITFPNQDHIAAVPIIEGTLERKSRMFKFSGFASGYYVVTKSKFLHEFKDEDYTHKDSTPELSIYLPDATIGVTSGEKFSVKGKDVSKGLGSKLSGHSDFQFKASSTEEAQKWVIKMQGIIGHSNLAILDSPEKTAVEEEKEPSTPHTDVEETPKGEPEKVLLVASLPEEGDDKIQLSPVPVTNTEKPVSAAPVDEKALK